MKTMINFRKLIIFLLTFSLLFMISCKTEDDIIIEENSTENILNDNAFLLDSTKVISSNDTSFILSKSTKRLPKIGEIILSGPS
uniref:hypothetical protein n=1 Tax=Chryseobacterium sp. TaxID=1871047 RepID=UPI003219DAC5